MFFCKRDNPEATFVTLTTLYNVQIMELVIISVLRALYLKLFQEGMKLESLNKSIECDIICLPENSFLRVYCIVGKAIVQLKLSLIFSNSSFLYSVKDQKGEYVAFLATFIIVCIFVFFTFVTILHILFSHKVSC